jgi:hypothetical protein
MLGVCAAWLVWKGLERLVVGGEGWERWGMGWNGKMMFGTWKLWMGGLNE